MMKKLIALTLVFVMAFSMTACGAKKGPEETKTPDGDEVVTIEFAQWWASEGDGTYYTGLVDEFEASHPNINVELVTLPFGDVRTVALSNQMAGESADLIGINPPWTREFKDFNVIAPLDEFIEGDDEYKLSNYNESAVAKIDGSIYALPVSPMGFFLYINKDMFEEAGVAIPTTWDEMRSAAKALTDVDNNKYGFTMTMSEVAAANGSIVTLYPLLYAQGGRTIVDGKYTVETPEMLNAMNFVKNLSDDGSLVPGITSSTDIQIVEQFSNGNVGMMIRDDAHIITLEQRGCDFDYTVIPIPTMNGEGVADIRHHGWDIAIASGSEHKAEAWEFIKFMTAKEQMQTFAEEMMKVSAYIDIDKAYLADYPILEEVIGYMNEYELVEELATMPSTTACWTALTAGCSQVIQGVATPEEALAACQEAWNATLNQK